MSKSLIISLLSIVIGLVTIAVGLYVLSTTPAPEADATSDPFVLVPQPQTTDLAGQDVPSAEAAPGSEPWCEQLMLRPDDRWSDQDARLFAQHCVYP